MVSGNFEGTDVPDFNALSPEEQRIVAERLMKFEESNWKPFWCANPTCSGEPHRLVEEEDGVGYHVYVGEMDTAGPNGEPVGDVEYDEDGESLGRPLLDPKWAHNHARIDQRLPPWLEQWVLFVMSGRGTGKTRTGVEFTTLSARRGLDGAIIGRRGTELINTHVAALIEHAHPDFMPEYLASKDILLWPNGAKTFLFSAERPENIRSVNLSYFWMDEAAFMPEVETAWMNARMATRIEKPNNPIHILITSTPTATKWVMEMEDDPEVEIRRVSTYANRANLSKDFLAMLEKKYEGTRKGRQELHGEVLRDVEGSLWNDDLFRHRRLDSNEFEDYIESLDARVVAVDPAGSKGKRSDATGIIGVGAHHLDDAGNRLSSSLFSVLARGTLKGTPNEWAERTFKIARLIRAHRIVVEKNFGGDMVKQVLVDYATMNPTTTCDENGEKFRIEVVHAVKSKETRAEATVGKYEQGRVFHVTSPTAYGDLSELEKQQVTWVPKNRGGTEPSPNDIDALVWGMNALEKDVVHKTVSASRDLVKQIQRPSARAGLAKGPGAAIRARRAFAGSPLPPTVARRRVG